MSDSKKNSIDEKSLRSSGPDFDRFINSALWYDMQNLIKDRIKYLQTLFLEAEDMHTIKNLQGQMKAWNEMLGLPAYLKQCAHAEKETKQAELEL